MIRKRLSQAMPFAVLMGGAAVGALATPWVGIASAETFEMALFGVVFFFVGRWFARRIRANTRLAYGRPKLSPAQKKDRRRADRRVTTWVGR